MAAQHWHYHFGEFILDEREHRLKGPAGDLHLQPKTFQTLFYLLKDPGRLVTKQDLLEAVWPDVSVTEHVLTRCVRDLRQVLGDDAGEPRFIETVPRLGYRFIATVEAIPAPAPDHTDRSPEAPTITSPSDNRPAPDRSQRRWPRPRSIWLSGAALALLAAGTTAGVLWRGGEPVPSFQPRGFVLVSDFDNQTGEPSLDRTLATAFAVSLEQSAYVNLLPRWRVREVLQRMGQPPERRIDEEVGREVCLREGARGMVAMSVARVGGRYALTGRLVDPESGTSVRSHVEYADGAGQLLPALERLAATLRRDLGEPLAAIRGSNRPLVDVTTPSLAALTSFADGVALWEKGEHHAAVELYENAIREDPGFAKAHAALGSAYYSHVFSDEMRGRQHYERALELTGRVTEREAMSIRMVYEGDLGHLDAAHRLFTAYLERYPDDFRARFNLATLLMRNGRPAEAVPHLAEVVRLVPSYASAHLNLATCAGLLGKYADARRSYEEAFSLEPEWLTSGNLNHEYGFLLARADDPARARQVFERALPTDSRLSAIRSLGLLDMYEGKYHAATARLGEAVALAAARRNRLGEARNRLFLAQALEGSGRRAEAAAELDRAAAAAAADRRTLSNWLLVRIAAAHARLGRVGPARKMLAVVRGGEADMKSPQQASDRHRLEGEVELASGRPDRALAAFTLADHESRGPFTAEGLARAARLAGDIDAAGRHYRSFLEMKDSSLGYEPQQDWLQAHYWLAQAYLSAQQPADARAALAPLLRTWENADADAPLVRNVRLLAARLQNSPRE